MVTKKKVEEQGADEGVVARGRPGRRTVAERTQAVLALLGGKTSVDQLAKQYGVNPATVEGWRTEAMGGIEAALRQGDGASPRERELERRVLDLEDALKDVSVKYALAQRGIQEWKAASRPTPRRRSPK